MAEAITERHELVTVEGPEARSFLDGLLSQDLSTLDQKRMVRSFLLAPQGKLRALLWVAGSEEKVFLVTDAGLGKRVTDDLRHYKIRVKAVVSEPEPVTTVLDSEGDLTEADLTASWAGTALSFVKGEVVLPPLDPDRYEGLRIFARQPVMDRDVDESTIPQETGLVEEAVSFTKGCFLGQELVARLDSRQGRVNRHLRVVSLSSRPELPAPLEDGGFITSVGTHEGELVGLGLLPRQISPGDELSVAGVTATVL